MRFYLLLLMFLAAGAASGGPFIPYEWDKNRSRYTLTPEEQGQAEVILLNHVEFNFGFENDQFLLQSVFHRIVYVNGAQAIQNNNRITIPMNNVIELMDLRARSISKDGKVTLFDKNNLKEMKNEETGNAYRIFAIEGIEAGGEVEYFFVRKMYPRLSDRSMIQSQTPIRKASFVLRTPKHLLFDVRSYNGFSRADTSSTAETRVYTATMNNIPALKREEYSYFDANRMRVEFKLAYNTARSRSRLNTWDDAAKTFYKKLYERDKDEVKALSKYAETFPKPGPSGRTGQIRAIEEKIKSSVTLNNESTDPGLSNLEQIIRSKVASNEGAARLFVGVFESLGIPAEVVMTCNRENIKFDGDFDSWNYLEEYFLYFPETKGFLSPHDRSTRYPLIASEYTAQRGLFIEPLELAGAKSGLASIREIPAPDYTLNMDNMDITVSFAQELDSATVRLKRIFMGYNGLFVTPYYHLMTKDQVHNLIEELTKQTAPDATIKSWTAEPATNLPVDAFAIDVTLKSAHFLQKAGGNYLFKLGELIGPQSELYADKERMTDVDNTHNRGYDRVITVNLPAGYRIGNPDDMRFDVVCREGSEVPFLFKSTYTIEGSLLTVKIEEYYKKVHAPKAQYEEFRKVINAAADFNKVTLVLEKAK